MIKRKLIVFAPHPDDEVLVCGGTIAKKVQQGYLAKVVIMTDGNYAFRLIYGDDCELTSNQVKEIRREESVRANKVLGISEMNVRFLDFEDQKLCESEKPAEEIITEILANYCPDEIFIPYKNSTHRDHKASFRIVTRSMRELGLKKLVYQYANLQKYNPINSCFDRITNLLKHNLINIDISDVLEIKKQAINEYRSQICITISIQTRPLIKNPERFLKPKEIFLVEKIT